MSYENIPLACISLEDKSHVLSQSVESVRRSYLWRWAGSMTRQVHSNHLIAQPGEEIQLASPDVQWASHSMDEEQSHVLMSPFTGHYLPLAVDHHSALGSPPALPGLLRLVSLSGSRCHSSCFSCLIFSSRDRLPPGLWDADGRRGVTTVCQFNLHGAVGLGISILAVFQFGARPVSQVLNE